MTEEEKIKLTPEEEKALKEYLGFGAGMPDKTHNAHSFLTEVKKDLDTTKTGNLSAEEVGVPLLTLRTHKELALVSDKILGNDFFKEYYEARGEILTSTSLSKDAKLINLVVIQKRQIEDITKPRQLNKGWFKPKPENIGGEIQHT